MNTNCPTCERNLNKGCYSYLMNLSPDELLLWCKTTKKERKWSNADIAAKTDIPKSTIDRLFSNEPIEFRFTIIQKIVRCLTGNVSEDAICIFANNNSLQDEKARQQVQELKEENQMLRQRILSIEEFHRADIASMKKEDQAKVDYLKAEVKALKFGRYILVVLLAICLILIFTALIMDKLNPDMGFFWLGNMFNGLAQWLA